nr:fatty acyl-CoA reductase 1-like [Dermacentor andersoni]
MLQDMQRRVHSCQGFGASSWDGFPVTVGWPSAAEMLQEEGVNTVSNNNHSQVLLEKLLRSCPVKRIYLLMRSKRGVEPEERLDELFKCEVFQLLKQEVPGARSKVKVVAGDLALPGLGLSEADMATICEEASVVFHLAATVRFFDTLKSLGDNVTGSLRQLQFGQPNNYALTKAVTEYLLLDEQRHFPLAIVRPSIVTASWREPFPGWIDNYYACTGVVVSAYLGLLPTVILSKDCVADLIPVDVVANTLICVGWQVATTRPTQLKVYNSASSAVNPQTWGELYAQVKSTTAQRPLPNPRRFPIATGSKVLYRLSLWFLRYVPALLGDVVLRLTGREASLVDRYRKAVNGMDATSFYTTNSWLFRSDNVVGLMNDLPPIDQQLFNLDIRKLNWCQYWDNYVTGIRKYLLKVDDKELPQERQV